MRLRRREVLLGSLGLCSSEALGQGAGGLEEREFEVPGEALARRCLLLVPRCAESACGRLLVLCHGLAETRSEAIGIRAWTDRYGLGQAYQRLEHPPVSRTLKDAVFLTDERLVTLNAELGRRPFRGFAVACPFTPNVFRQPSTAAALDRYAAWLVDGLLPEAAKALGGPLKPELTAIDGVSLGGFVSLEVFLRRPEAFAAVGSTQGAFGVPLADTYAARLASALGRVGPRSLRVATSAWDSGRPASERLVRRLRARDIPVVFDASPGPHDQRWLREVGSLELLFDYDRARPWGAARGRGSVTARPGFARKLMLQAAAGLDRAVTLAVRVGAPVPESEPPTTEGHEARVRVLTELAERYQSLDLDHFFPEPRAIEPVARAAGQAAGGLERIDLAWPSRSEPFLPEIREHYTKTLENQVAVARLLARQPPRPVAILVHGYLLGRLGVEEHVWPIARLDAFGVDSALLVLPFHGRRANPERSGRPEFPGSDPRMANEGFRQIITDLRELAGWLRRRGHPAVGVLGMSLGGYTAALAATVEANLDFVVPVIPLASLADFAFEQGHLADAPEPRALEHGLLERVHRIVSPVERASLIEPARMLVIGARADRITPLSHARRLALHFRAPLATFPGGHLLQLGRAAAFERVGELFGQLGLHRS